ncbi:MAG: CbiX/SirB N-terminal domain-containing protein [Eubacteriaceae bacterium]|jgi:sirohydrochlorin ferrochelatase|nr:CbiX/SirB N-terminal domain-containing protein [Eubacteriaceae bacterium]
MGNKAIVILAHGSREDRTVDTLHSIVSQVREQLASEVDAFVEEAFMQFRSESLKYRLDSLVERGYEDIAIIPYFLFDGVHIKEDIPAEIAEFESNNPNVKIKLGKTLGTDSRMASIVTDRILEIL